MPEIKCPNCQHVIKLDKSEYDALLNDVEKEEIDKRVNERITQLEENYKANLALQTTKIESKKNDELSTLKNEIGLLKQQLKDSEDKYKNQLDVESTKLESQKNQEVAKLNEQIAALKEQLKNGDTNTKLAVKNALDEVQKELNAKDQEITKLQNKIDASETDKKLEISEALQGLREEINEKDKEILKLNNDVETAKKESKTSIQELMNQHDFELKAKDVEIEKWKNFRMGDSTKDLGESLEKYCEDQFESVRSYAFPNSYFEKDTENVEGSKGDYVFREMSEDGIEIVSIMFEMKNQKDDTEHKHKNEEFFKKLDKDRKNKKCEYAVLVSTLEEDSKTYNQGIVDVSHKFPKMYVIRPQHFVAIIGLLRSMAKESLKYKRSVVQYQQENIDVTNFENNVKAVMAKISDDYEKANSHYNEVEKMCDDMIIKLKNLKEAFRLGRKWIGAAQNQLPDLEIRKLTKNNQTMKEKFEALEKDKD